MTKVVWCSSVVFVLFLLIFWTSHIDIINEAGLTNSNSSSGSELPKGWNWAQYHNHEEVIMFLTWVAEKHSSVVDLQSIGHSFEGRELLTVRLSGKRPKSNTHRPITKVKLVGGIHGNEQACPELLLRLVHHLASGYGSNSRITRLLDSTDVYVLPVMNPDGRAADTRVNAAGRDLNRNFPLDPLPFDAPGLPSPDDSETVQAWRKTGAGPPQPEVAAVMAWSKQHDFQLSASLHQGALVANYPFDSCDTQALIRYCPSLDDPLPLFLARAYAINHPAMHLNSNDTTGFVQGTVQGAQWYTLLGGMQDWVYWDRHSLELTLELNPIMKPPVEEVGGIMWQQNLPALMRFMELAHMGLHAQLLDAHNSQPLQGHVEVLAPSRHRPLNVTDAGGYFSMMLAPDTVYCLAIHPHGPANSRHAYRPVNVAVLHLGGSVVMKGKGIKGIAERAVFRAVRQSEALLSSTRRLLGGHASQGATHLGATLSGDGDVVAVGQATPDMCWFDMSSLQ